MSVEAHKSHMDVDIEVDPIEVQIVRERMIAVPNMIEKNIERTAFSVFVQDYKDFAVGFVDHEGRLVTQSRYSLPGFVANALGLGVRAGIDFFGLDDMHEGDVFIVNDVHTMGKHLNDVCAFRPIVVEGRILGFFAVLVHWVDIGGMTPGSCLSPTTTDIFQEGVQYPPIRLIEKGVRRRDVFRMIELNSRWPRLVLGDLDAQLGGCAMGAGMIREIVEQHDLATVLSAIDAMHSDADARMERALVEVPEGEYTASAFFDDDGINYDQRIEIKVKVIFKDGQMTVDFNGCSPEVKGPFNAGLDGGAVAVARMAAKFLFSGDTPVNEGDFDRVRVVVPDGTFLSASVTAAHGSAGNTHATTVDAILSAMSDAMPERIPAGHHGIYGTHTITGVDERDGSPFICLDAMSGGWGAFWNKDGPGPFRSLTHGDVSEIPVEMQEALYPYRIEAKYLRQDSGGIGRHRGGIGITKVYHFLQPMVFMNKIDRRGCPPWGIKGGGAGRSPDGEIVRSTGSRDVLQKGRFDMQTGDKVTISSGGGGGYGDPAERDAEAVARDVRLGYVSVDAAKHDYLAAVSPDGTLDPAETARLRGKITPSEHTSW